MKNNSNVDRISVENAVRVTHGKIREALGFAGYKPTWEGEGGHHQLECFVGGKLGVVIIQIMRDRERFSTGIEVFAPLTQTNSIQDTLDVIAGKPSRLEQTVDALLAGVNSSQNEKVDAMLRSPDAVESHRNQFTMVPVLYGVLVNLVKARRLS